MQKKYGEQPNLELSSSYNQECVWSNEITTYNLQWCEILQVHKRDKVQV